MILSKINNTLFHKIKYKSLRALNYIIVLFAFVMPLHRDLGKLTIIIMIIVWLFSLDIKRCYSFLVGNRILQVLMLFIIYITSSIFWSEQKVAALEWVYLIYKYLFIVILITISSLDKKYISYIISAFLLSMLINMLATYYMFFYSTEDIFGLGFTEHNSYLDYSIFAAFSIFLSLYRFLNEKNSYLKVFYFIFIIAMTANLFISEGRSGQLTFILTSFVLALIYLKNNIKHILYSFASIILVLFLSYNFSKNFNSRINLAISEVVNVIKNTDYDSSIGVRLSAYKILPELLKENNILFGSGIGDVRGIVHKKYIQTFGTGKMFDDVNGHIHNTFLSILISLGIVGLSIFVYFLYSILKLRLIDDKLELIKYSFIFTIVFSSFADNLLGQISVLMLFALFFSILVVLSKQSKISGETKRQEKFTG